MILFQNTEQGERPFERLRKSYPKRIVNCSLEFKDIRTKPTSKYVDISAACKLCDEVDEFIVHVVLDCSLHRFNEFQTRRFKIYEVQTNKFIEYSYSDRVVFSKEDWVS